MKISYIEPDCKVVLLNTRSVVCASFNSTDHTENWDIDAEETI